MYYPAKKFKPFGEMSSHRIACKVSEVNVLAMELTPLRSSLLTTSPDRLSCLIQSDWVWGADNTIEQGNGRFGSAAIRTR
jgi:hypothetical protein